MSAPFQKHDFEVGDRSRGFRAIWIRCEDGRELPDQIMTALNQHAALLSQVARLREGLKPFAKFACDEPHVGEPVCHNCVARALLAETEGGE